MNERINTAKTSFPKLKLKNTTQSLFNIENHQKTIFHRLILPKRIPATTIKQLNIKHLNKPKGNKYANEILNILII